MSKPTDTGPGDRIRATLHAAYGRPLTDDEILFINRQHEVLSIRVAEAEARAQAAEEDRERWIDTAYDHEQRQWKAEDRLAEAEARAGRWKRLSMTIFERTKEQGWVDERMAAIADLRAHGDLPDTEEAKDE
jgi:hypothetical protein